MIERIKQKISASKEACNYSPLTRVIPSADILEIVEQEKEKPQTNADRIRSMTDDELAEFLKEVKEDYQWANPDYPDCDDCGEWLEWLQSEAGEAEMEE